jgi:hypothetical protein
MRARRSTAGPSRGAARARVERTTSVVGGALDAAVLGAQWYSSWAIPVWILGGGAMWAAKYLQQRYTTGRTDPPAKYAIAAVSFNFQRRPGHMAVAWELDGKIVHAYGMYSRGGLPSKNDAVRAKTHEGFVKDDLVEMKKAQREKKRPYFEEVHTCTKEQWEDSLTLAQAYEKREDLRFDLFGVRGFSCASFAIRIMQEAGQSAGSWITRQIIADPGEMTLFTQDALAPRM